MRKTTQVTAIIVCWLVTTTAALAGQRPQSRRVSEEHDNWSNADYTTALDNNGNALITVKAGDFLLEKAVDSSGLFTLRISQNKDVVTIVHDPAGYLVTRGKRSARLDARSDNPGDARDAVKALLLGSQAVRSFRRLSNVLENRDEREAEGPAVLGTLIDGALVQMLDGDPGAVPRIAKRTIRKNSAQLKAVRFLPGELFKDCVGMYEWSLYDAWAQYAACMEWAANVHWWFEPWAEDWCHWEWLARSQQYLWQFVQCLALPI